MNQLDTLKSYTVVVADTGDIESIKKIFAAGCYDQSVIGAEGCPTSAVPGADRRRHR